MLKISKKIPHASNVPMSKAEEITELRKKYVTKN
jgi:hypothetical protein